MKPDQNWKKQIAFSLILNFCCLFTLYAGQTDTSRKNEEESDYIYIMTKWESMEQDRKEELRFDKIEKINEEWYLIELQIVVSIIQMILTTWDNKCTRILGIWDVCYQFFGVVLPATIHG